jgi:hypothetical protein
MRLERRLLDYIDEMAPSVTTEEAIARKQSPNRAWMRVASAPKRRAGDFMTKTEESAKTQTPGQGRGLAWAIAAFALVLVAGGLYFAFSGDDGQVVDQTTVPTPTTVLTTPPNPTQLPEFGQELDPGVYFIDADDDPSTTTGITYRIEGPGWMSQNGPSRDNGSVSLHLHQVQLRFGPHSPGCNYPEGPTSEAAEFTAADLADEFAANGFSVREAPAPVSAFGHDGYHVVVEVPEGCDDAVGFQYNAFAFPGDVIEAWLFDIDGQIVIVEANWKTEATDLTASPEEDVAELRAVIDTVVLTRSTPSGS